MKGDPLYSALRTSRPGVDLLTHKQATRLQAFFAAEKYVKVAANWGMYHRMIAAYRHEDRHQAKS